MTLRVHTPTDLGECARLFLQMYGAQEPGLTQDIAEARLRRMLDACWSLTELRDGPDVIGFALWVDLVEYVFLRSFAIDADRRAGGLGRRFAEKLEAEAFPPGVPIRLEVAEDGPHGFWASVGFKTKTTGMWLTERAAG